MIWSMSGADRRREVAARGRWRRSRTSRPSRGAAGDLVGGVDGRDRVVVVEVDDRGAHERAEHLRRPVGRAPCCHGKPRRSAWASVTRRVEVRAGHSARDPHAEGDADAPAGGDQQPVAAGQRTAACRGRTGSSAATAHRDASATRTIQDDDRGARPPGHQLAGHSLPPALRLCAVRRHSPPSPSVWCPAPAGYRPRRDHALSLPNSKLGRLDPAQRAAGARPDARGDVRRARHRRRGDGAGRRSTPRRAGCRSALVEARDFASGTSSRSQQADPRRPALPGAAGVRPGRARRCASAACC